MKKILMKVKAPDEEESGMKARKDSRSKELFEKCTAHLKEAAFHFVQENAKVIMTKGFTSQVYGRFILTHK